MRLILDDARSGAWNMAADQWLMENCAATGEATLRFYRWSEPTVSLGYFQSIELRHGHPSSRECPIVRRTTGGGAIVHDAELTYCLTLPVVDRVDSKLTECYELVHQELIEVLAQKGVTATLVGDAGTREPYPPFLCFQRRAPQDVLVSQQKILGSAQKRRQGVLLQHGSLLLAKSTEAPELPGLSELTGQELNAEEIIASWSQRLLNALSWKATEFQWGPREIKEIRTIAETKFANPTWTGKR